MTNVLLLIILVLNLFTALTLLAIFERLTAILLTLHQIFSVTRFYTDNHRPLESQDTKGSVN